MHDTSSFVRIRVRYCPVSTVATDGIVLVRVFTRDSRNCYSAS